MIKADFDILFKNALRRGQAMNEQNSPTNAMDLYLFMDAIEMLCMKLYPQCKPMPPGSTESQQMSLYEGLRTTLNIVKL